MANRMLAKLSKNLTIYRQELRDEGLTYLITARIIKFPISRSLYNSFKPQFVKVGNHLMYIDPKDMIVSQVLYTKRVWDPYTSAVFRKVLRKGDTVLDIGSHIGYYALLAAEIVGKHGSVTAFEPDTVSYGLLKKNRSVNNYENITPINKAVSEKNAIERLYINRLNTGDNKLIKDGTTKEYVKIETIKLDDFLKVKKVDVIKIDIQGAELRALKGMTKLLKANPKCRILIEFWPSGLVSAGTSAKELLAFLGKLDYRFLLVDEERKETKKITSSALLQKVASGELYDTNLLCYKATDSRFPL